MKRVLLVALLVVSMLAMVGFTSVEGSYWNDMKDLYEWNAMEGESDLEFNMSFSGMNYEYKIHTYAQTDLGDFSSYSEMKIEDMQGLLNIPTIKMYTHGSDLYVNKEAVLSLLSALGVDGISIKEDYVMLEGEQGSVDVDKNVINEVFGFLAEMDLGMGSNMVKEDNTYTLSLESGELVDFLDEYVKYFIKNIDKLPASLMQGQEVIITEAEKQEILQAYSTFVNQYKDMAKAFIDGSKLYMQSTFGEDKYSQNSELVIKTPMGELSMNSTSDTSKLESVTFKLPTSVKKITMQELEQMILDYVGMGAKTRLVATVKLDGSYVKYTEYGLEQRKVGLKVENGKAYTTSEEMYKLLGVNMEKEKGYFHIRTLDNYGYRVDWNEVEREIEIYR